MEFNEWKPSVWSPKKMLAGDLSQHRFCKHFLLGQGRRKAMEPLFEKNHFTFRPCPQNPDLFGHSRKSGSGERYCLRFEQTFMCIPIVQ